MHNQTLSLACLREHHRWTLTKFLDSFNIIYWDEGFRSILTHLTDLSRRPQEDVYRNVCLDPRGKAISKTLTIGSFHWCVSGVSSFWVISHWTTPSRSVLSQHTKWSGWHHDKKADDQQVPCNRFSGQISMSPVHHEPLIDAQADMSYLTIWCALLCASTN